MNSAKAGVYFLVIFTAALAVSKAEPAKGAAASDSPPISVEARVDKPLATVGDVVTYTIAITRNADTDFSQPEPEAFEGFELLAMGAHPSISVKDVMVQEFWFRLRADLVGKYTFPAYPIDFQTPDAKGRRTPGQTATPKVDVEILSVLHLRGKPTDIHDIKPLVKVKKDWYPYILMTLAVAALIFLAQWGRRKWEKRIKPEREKVIPDIILSPHELAIIELNQLIAQGLLRKDQFREYYFKLSEIFRRYLGSRYSFPALDWTTEEISVQLNKLLGLNNDLRREACSILGNTDWVKFAKGETDADSCMADMEAIKNFISRTLKIETTAKTNAVRPAA